jgi:hypothetical protein
MPEVKDGICAGAAQNVLARSLFKTSAFVNVWVAATWRSVKKQQLHKKRILPACGRAFVTTSNTAPVRVSQQNLLFRFESQNRIYYLISSTNKP